MALAVNKTGTKRDETLTGDSGDDTLYGAGGADILKGMDGDDNISSGMVYNETTRSWGVDDQGDMLDGGNGNDSISGGVGNDTLLGGAGDDKLNGNGGKDRLQGGAGNDNLQSGATYDPVTETWGPDLGGDLLEGGDGDDQLYGNDGDDTLDGGSGRDLMYGGTGNDTYIVRDLLDTVWDAGGIDKGIIYADWFRPTSSVENWTWAPGVQQLPNWIAALAVESPDLRLAGAAKIVNYHFAQEPADFFRDNDKNGFTPFNEVQRAFTRQVFDYISSVVNVQFRESGELNGENVLVMANNLQTTSGGYGGPRILMLSTKVSENLAPTTSNYGVDALLHEIGHSLGMKHPFSHTDANGDTGIGPFLSDFEDKGRYTLMSYTKEYSDYRLYYSPLDIAALQYIYGPSQQMAAGDTTWKLDAGAANFIADGSGRDTIDGSALTGDITVDLRPGYWGFLGAKAESIVQAAQVTVNFGTVVENLVGGSGNDTLTGNEVANRIEGGAGNDILSGGAGSDTLDGGEGSDIAAYAGKFGDYRVKVGKDGSTVSGAALPGEVDTLSSIERLKFGDVMVNLDIGGVAGQAYRLYQAAFNRTPDLGGLGYWIGQMEKGIGLNDVAAAFIGSDEFVKQYGAKPGNSDFLKNIYQNILHRAPDPAGFDFWLKNMDAGLASTTEVLVQFSEGNENRIALAGVLEGGVAYLPYG